MNKRIVSILAIALALLLLAGCGETDFVQNGYDTGAYEDAEFSTVTSEAAEMPAEGVQAAESADKIIYTAELTMETTSFDETITALEHTVSDLGGFTQNSNVSGDTSYGVDGSVTIINRSAYYTVRIPSNKLDAFLKQTGTLGNVTYSNKSATNVTAIYADNERRQASLETEEGRLLELIAQADKIEDLIVLEDKLSDVRYEIESIQGTLRDYDQQIAYSTVDIDIREVSGYRAPVAANRSFFERLGDAFVGGLKDVLEFFGNIVVGVAGAIVPLGVLAAVIVWIVKASKRRKKKKANTQTKP